MSQSKYIVKYEKDSCKPCEAVSDLLNKHNVEYIKINAFDEPEKAMKDKIRSLPTVLLKDSNTDETVKRVAGFNHKELLDLIEEWSNARKM